MVFVNHQMIHTVSLVGSPCEKCEQAVVSSLWTF